MKFKYLNVFLVAVFIAVLSSCAIDKSNSANQPKAGLLQAIVGGKTEPESRNDSSDEYSKFKTIASHTVMVTIEETTGNHNNFRVASGVILDERFIVTSAHTFEGNQLGTVHVGAIYFGSTGTQQTRFRQEFTKRDILNLSSDRVEELSSQGWSTKAGNKDYVFIRLEKALPYGFSPIRMMNDISFFARGDHYSVAGFGYYANNKLDYQLRMLSDLILSRSNINEPAPNISEVGSALGFEDRKYFLEFQTTASGEIMPGDSGGPVYFETKNSNGQTEVYLAGITTGSKHFGNKYDCENHISTCLTAEYALRIDAFHDDAINIANKIRNNIQ